MHSSRCKTSNR